MSSRYGTEQDGLMLAQWDADIERLVSENARLRCTVAALRVFPARPHYDARGRWYKKPKTGRRVHPEWLRAEAVAACRFRLIREVAKIYGVNERTIYDWRREQKEQAA